MAQDGTLVALQQLDVQVMMIIDRDDNADANNDSEWSVDDYKHFNDLLIV